MKHVAFLAKDILGDALTSVNDLDEIVRLYSPCFLTVFCTERIAQLYENYACVGRVVLFEPDRVETMLLPDEEFEAVFNPRYDKESATIVRRLRRKSAYGFENVDIPEEVCRKLYTAYLPLTLWDNKQLRCYTSVTEQRACLIRLVNPQYHNNCTVLTESNFPTSHILTQNIPEKLFLVIPCASYPRKAWPLEHYCKVAKYVRSCGYVPRFILGPMENNLKERIKSYGFEYLADLNLVQLVAVIRRAIFAIGNDTGPMHLVCASECPSLTLSAEDAHYIWFPYDVRVHGVLHAECSEPKLCKICKNCEECINLITIDTVTNELERRL